MPTRRERLKTILRESGWAALFLLGLGLVVAGLYVHGASVYASPDVKEDRAKLRELEVEGRAIVLGSSHGKGVRLESMGLVGQNFAHNGGDLYEIAYIARSVKRRVPRIDTVLIALSYFSFGLDNAAYVQHGTATRIERRITMYSAFPRLTFVPGDQREYLKGLLYPVVTRDHFQRGLASLWKGATSLFHSEPESDRSHSPGAPASADSPAAADAQDNDDSETNPDGDVPGGDEPDDEARPEPPKADKPRKGPKLNKTDAWYRSQAHGRCSAYAGYLRNMHRGHPSVERDTVELLHRLARSLRSQGVSVVLFTPPYHPEYNACFDPRYQELTRKNGAAVAQATGARYFDFSNMPAFVADTSLFLDADHLRPAGKKLFSRALAEAMKSSPP